MPPNAESAPEVGRDQEALGIGSAFGKASDRREQVKRKLVRSPHILEVLASYGSVCVLLSYLCMAQYGLRVLEWFALATLGCVIYTLMEYIFHRVVLHEYIPKIHANHHKQPRNLRIIATPILPVQVYDFVVVLLIMAFAGRPVAYAINCGISFGQCVMDLVHIAFHSRWRPWYLESARSYHLVHHFIDDEVAHGLTTSFWDMVFGTFPTNWAYSKKLPWLKYLQLPFPLLTFVLIGLFVGDETRQVARRGAAQHRREDETASVERQHDSALKTVRMAAEVGQPRFGYLILTFSTAMMVVCGWQWSSVFH